MPKKISIKLNSKKYIEKRTQGYKVFVVPTLQQLQNFVKYLKTKVCTKNNVEDIKKIVTVHKYYDDIDRKELFIFGADVGNGTEECIVTVYVYRCFKSIGFKNKKYFPSVYHINVLVLFKI